ncbi:ATP-binding protein [Crenobacter sp. SG2303]|uniref:ATP-binding protein n=1 Tax=Crenobacter oryzisoli TaxID=3056844 RepID=A0ABT7XNW8_9NEIS|nr:ATP-binding protein [Crenobacter sp. SG2303]MDN0075486.1 ATP-binding protein [Crenobacter sp. SG2303]
MSEKTRNAPPRASAMMEALRGLGYSTAAALADIVDNSVSAGASEVRVEFTWHGNGSRISVLDDGRGMDDYGLEAAMRLGDKSPLDARDPGDLGRFGMGLKTASFSQCRRLTVASKMASGDRACLRWDLDAIAERPEDGWILFEGPAKGSEGHLAPLDGVGSGTLVLWERLDRIVTDGYTADHFLALIEDVEKRLAMVFHRLLEGPRPKLRLLLNGRAVAPWDPFMIGHPGKPWNSPVQRRHTPFGVVEAECHVLPHRDRLTQAEHDNAAGPEGWTSQQGFYVYRNGRLLLAGGWLGLGQGRAWNREEAQRLARIRLDIPNTADADWKIDIRKSTARIPVALRSWLTTLAEDTRNRARRAFAYRGSPAPGPGAQQVEQAWTVERLKNGMRYRVDPEHPAVAAVLEAAGPLLPLVKAMLRVVEETVPVQRIWLDTAESKETPLTCFEGEPPAHVAEILCTLFEDMVGRRGMSHSLAKRTLASTEPFQKYPSLVDALPDGSSTGADNDRRGA